MMKRVKKISSLIFVVMMVASASIALADAPVVDLSQGDNNQTQAVGASTQAYTNDDNNAAANSSNDDEGYSGTVEDEGAQSSLSLNDRVSKLENQMSNLTTMNLAGTLSELQQQMQQLQGEFQVQQHDLKMLDEQERNFYQDLDQRLTALENNASNNRTAANTPASATASQTTTAAVSPHTELSAYQTAFQYVRQKSYGKAVAALQDFLSKYPNGEFAPNAHYWLGEVYYSQNQKDKAQTEFTTIINNYPKSQKVPGAMLKYGYILQAQGDHAKAQALFEQIIQKYPNSSVADLAKIQLEQMKAGHPTPTANDI